VGLDIVELIVGVEKAFAIKIADRDAQKIFTVGNLVNYVRSKVGKQCGTICLTSHTFYRFRSELMRALPLSRRQIRPAGTLEALVPATKRRRLWAQLRASGLNLPALRLSTEVVLLTAILVLAPSVALVWWYRNWALLGLTIPLGVFASQATRPLAFHLDQSWTVREATLYATPALSQDIEARERLSDAEIAAKIRLIISTNLVIPVEQLTDDARFVEDLGAE
jgi:acyl carrier protein